MGLDVSMDIGRHAEGVPCPRCNGYADRVDATLEERQRYGCKGGADDHGCCSRAFVCRLCGERILGTADSPEMG